MTHSFGHGIILIIILYIERVKTRLNEGTYPHPLSH